MFNGLQSRINKALVIVGAASVLGADPTTEQMPSASRAPLPIVSKDDAGQAGQSAFSRSDFISKLQIEIDDLLLGRDRIPHLLKDLDSASPTEVRKTIKALGRYHYPEVVQELERSVVNNTHGLSSSLGIQIAIYNPQTITNLIEKHGDSVCAKILSGFAADGALFPSSPLPSAEEEATVYAFEAIFPTLLAHSTSQEAGSALIKLLSSDNTTTRLLLGRALQKFSVEEIATKFETLGQTNYARSLREGLALGFNRPFIFSPHALASVVQNRNHPERATGKIALLFTPSGDYNGASYEAGPRYDELLSQGYALVAYEEKRDSQVTSDMLSFKSRYHPAEVIIASAHGCQTSMAFDLKNKWRFLPFGNFDIGDLESLKKLGVSDILAPNGQVILFSCSNGEGRAGVPNMANSFRELFPQACENGIWSATAPFDAGTVIVEYEHGRIQKVTFGSWLGTYRAQIEESPKNNLVNVA